MITAASSATVASSTAPAPAAPLPPQRPVHVLTFADRPTIYLDALAASVMHFNEGAPLHVLGLSNRRTPAHPGPHWNIPRRAISGADPGKLKKLWGVCVRQCAARVTCGCVASNNPKSGWPSCCVNPHKHLCVWPRPYGRIPGWHKSLLEHGASSTTPKVTT
jgi:hypothetical protein